MASTEKLPSGKYRGVYRDAAKKKQHTRIRDRKQDARADAIEAEAIARRQADVVGGTPPTRMTYAEWVEVWRELRAIEPSTADIDERMIQHDLLPYWGDKLIAAIAQTDVQDWVNYLRRRPKASRKKEGTPPGGLLGGSVNRYYRLFRSSMSDALTRKVITAHPCTNIELPSPKRAKDNERILTRQEIHLIRSRLGFSYRIVTGFMQETGLRPNEVGGLHRDRIDRTAGWMTVNEAYDHYAKRIKGYPKDKESRDVPLTSRALELLDEYDERYPECASTCGIPHQFGRCYSDLMFRTDRKRGPIDSRYLLAAWTGAQNRAGIRRQAPPYALRHFYASTLAEAGVDPWEIARLMGHASLGQSGVYVHRTAGARLRVLAALGDTTAQGLTVVRGAGPEAVSSHQSPTQGTLKEVSGNG